MPEPYQQSLWLSRLPGPVSSGMQTSLDNSDLSPFSCKGDAVDWLTVCGAVHVPRHTLHIGYVHQTAVSGGHSLGEKRAWKQYCCAA